MLKYNLKIMFWNRGIRYPQAALVRAGFNRQTASRIVAGRFKSLDAQQIEKLCTVFKCLPNDLFEFTPDENTPADLPLNKLKKLEFPKHLVYITDELPYDKIPEYREKAFQVKEEILKGSK